MSAMIGGLRAKRLSDGSNISDIVIAANGPADVTGGDAIRSLPYFNTPLPVPVADTGLGFTSTEIATLNSKGGSVMGNNIAGNAVILSDVYTTYKTDSAGNADPTWEFLNYVDTGSGSREYMFNNVRSDCAQSRLTDGDLAINRNIHNENSIIGLFIDYYATLSGDNYLLLRSGETNRQFFIDNLSVTLDLAAGKVTVIGKNPIVTQLREIDATFQIVFATS
jgi:hypothetical protein